LGVFLGYISWAFLLGGGGLGGGGGGVIGGSESAGVASGGRGAGEEGEVRVRGIRSRPRARDFVAARRFHEEYTSNFPCKEARAKRWRRERG
jgi:hypothetical protein